MKSIFLLLAVFILLPIDGNSQSMIELLTEELSSFDMIQDDTMFSGEGGTGEQFTPQVAEVYFNFLEAATVEDLKSLMHHDSPVVACYSYRGLLDKAYSPIVPILSAFQGDTKEVESVSDDIIEVQTCYQWMLDRTKFHISYKGLRLEAAEKEAFDKLMDEERRRIRREVVGE